VIIIVFIAYLLASVFLSVFSFSATTILQCFIIDQELSTKAGRSAQHTPDSLKEFLEINDAAAAKNGIIAGESESDRKYKDEAVKANQVEVGGVSGTNAKKANDMA
jgi:hypothetical protein